MVIKLHHAELDFHSWKDFFFLTWTSRFLIRKLSSHSSCVLSLIASITNTYNDVSSSCIWYSHRQLVGMISGFSWENIKLDLVFEKDSIQKDKKQGFSSKTLPVMPVGSPEPHCPGQGNWDAPLAHLPLSQRPRCYTTFSILFWHFSSEINILHMHENKLMLYT